MQVSNGARYTFTSKELDKEAGVNWHYFGARYYDAGIGRWLTADPLADRFPSWTPYNYTLNNPLRLVDPDGMAPGNPAKIYVNKLKGHIQESVSNFVQKNSPLLADAASTATGVLSYKFPPLKFVSIGFKALAVWGKTDNPYFKQSDIVGDGVGAVLGFVDPLLGEATDKTVEVILDESGKTNETPSNGSPENANETNQIQSSNQEGEEEKKKENEGG